MASSSLTLASVTLTSPTILMVRFTQDVIQVQASGVNDALNLSNYTLDGPGSWYVRLIVPVNARTVKVVLTGTLAPGLWSLTVANIQSIGGTELSSPTALTFLVLDGGGSIPASGGATNDSPYDILVKHLGPGLVTTANKGWRSLVSGLASGIEYLTQVGQAAFPQLFLSTATGTYLDYLAASDGITRPPNLGISDKLFRELAIQLRSNKLTEIAYLQILRIFFGEDAVQAYSLSTLFEPYDVTGGETLTITINEQQTITFTLSSDSIESPGAGTALEIATALTRAFEDGLINAEAMSFQDIETGGVGIKIRSKALGLASSVRIDGGTLQNLTQFPTFLESADTAATWTVSSPYGGIVRWTTTGATTVDLSLIQEGDYFIVTGSNFNALNRGTWVVDSVSVAYPGGTLTQSIDVRSITYFAQAGVVIADSSDIMWYRPTRQTIDATTRTVIVSHLNGSSEVNVVMPVTSQTVNRTANTAAYLQPTATAVQGSLIEKFDDNIMYVTTSTNHGLVAGDWVNLDGWGVTPQRIHQIFPPNVTGPTLGGESQHAPYTLIFPQVLVKPTAPGQNYTQTKLLDGTVLVAGGGQLTSIGGGAFDPPIVSVTDESAVFTYTQTGTEILGIGISSAWIQPNTMNSPRMGHTATLLNDGTVLVAGGHDGAIYLNTTEIYDPVADTWTPGPNMSNARMLHRAIRLPNDRVLLIGGFTADTTPSATCDIYDPVAGTIAAVSSLIRARGGHGAVLLANFQVLAVGGRDYNSLATATVGDQIFSCELYDYVNDVWTLASPIDYGTWIVDPIVVGNHAYIVCNEFNNNGDFDNFRNGVNLRRYEDGRWYPVLRAVRDFVFNNSVRVPPGSTLIYVPERNYLAIDIHDSSYWIYNLKDGTFRAGPAPLQFTHAHVGDSTLLDGNRVILSSGGSIADAYSDTPFIGTLNADVTLQGNLNGLFRVDSIVTATKFSILIPRHFSWPSYTTASNGTVTPWAAPDRIFSGPYAWDPDSGVAVTGSSSELDTAIASHSQIATINVADATQFPDDSGYLVFDFGLATQTGPVAYFGRRDATHLEIDFTFVFPYDLAVGASVAWLNGKGAFVPQDTISAGSFWVTENAAGRLAAINTISSISAVGTTTNFFLKYPGDYGLGAAGYPTQGADKLSSIVEIYASDDINADLEFWRAQ